MAVDPKSDDGQAIRKLFPLETMPARQYNTLCSEIEITETPKGSFLFKLGDEPDSYIYLIQGSVSLEAEEFKIVTINAGTDSAKFAIAHQFPRQISARAAEDVRYVSLNLNAFDKQETEDIEEENNYMVENEDDSEKEISEDWMSALLKSPIFQRLPAMNLQQVLISLEEVEFKKGEIIFNQGDIGDYYYLVRKGRCALSRRASDRAKEIKLLNLRENDTFGEDSLLSGEPRSMTITAISDMVLSRIDKERFIKLIKEPALSYINYQHLLDERDLSDELVIVDVRPADDYKENHIEGSQNIPFFSLRLHVKDLKKQSKKIALVCDDGTLSEAAAFVLIKNRIDAEVLKGGMQSIPESSKNEGEATYSLADESDEENSESSSKTDLESLGNELAAEESETQDTDVELVDADYDLELENETLKAENKFLTTELENIKKQYKLLYMQTEKIKAAFDKLNNK